MYRTLPFLLLLVSLAGCDLTSSTKISAPPWAVSGLAGHDIQELKIHENTLYAATDSGLYRRPLSSNTSWRADGLQGKRIVDLTWRADGAMLAGVRYEGQSDGPVLYKRAASSGTTWTPFEEGYGPSEHRTVRALAAVPSARDTLYARGARNVARSVDGGQHWESVLGDWNAAGYQAPLLYISPHTPSLTFAGGETSIFQPYLVRSPDHGAAWQPSTGLPRDGDNAVYSMIEHPAEPGHFLLGMEGHILRSTDGGQTWSTLYEPAQYTYVFDFAAVRMGGQTVIYAAGAENGTQGGRLTLHRTDDFGDSWERIVYEEGPSPTAIRTMVSRDQRLYLGTTVGVYVYRP